MRRDRWTARELCAVLDVSEAGYYKYVRSLGRPDKDAFLSAQIQSIIDDDRNNDNYGVPRMKLALSRKGISIGVRRLTRLMKEMHLIHPKKRRPYGLTKATGEIQERENLIKQSFYAKEPFRLFLTDISMIGCSDGKLYISPIMDGFNGEIVSLQMRDNMKKELCIDTFRALAKRYPVNGAILHSDRGSQYTSGAFREELSKAGVLQSLSGVHHCYDNARMESFFATLKKELLYRLPTYRMSRDEVQMEIFRYVFIYYNRKRIYTSNPEGMPPEVYRKARESSRAGLTAA